MAATSAWARAIASIVPADDADAEAQPDEQEYPCERRADGGAVRGFV